ncbi:MAG TPA: hypothetical protein VMT35_20000 [Ignavibacteriaceae bacterium]|nr:hypothetical protein [Ignavibacteriaceae bacterium]
MTYFFKNIPMLYIAFIILLVSKAEAQKTHDSLEYETCIRSNLQHWVNFWKQFDDQFDVSILQFREKNVLKYESRLVWDSVQSSRVSDKSFCFFSPDSNKMADIYSYRYGPLKELPDRKVFISGGEPDTEVKLIDLAKDSIYIFLSSGTPTEYQDACWYDSSTLIVAGCNENDEQLNTYYPFYYILDFENKFILLYKENAHYKPGIRNYIRYKFDVAEE